MEAVGERQTCKQLRRSLKEEENGLIDNPEKQETRREEFRKCWLSEKRQIKEQQNPAWGCNCVISSVSGLKRRRRRTAQRLKFDNKDIVSS